MNKIEIKGISKRFDTVRSLDNVCAAINQGSIFGLIGSNGAGKSTLLRIMSGIYKQDSGDVFYNGQTLYDNPVLKEEIVYVSDDLYFFPHGTVEDMMNFYTKIYPGFDKKRYFELCDMFRLDRNRKINTFSKGMQKQAAMLLALSIRPKYLLCDETFDGLDPVMRQFIKRLIADDVAERGVTPIIASHNLRELEDICDHIGLLHSGGIVFDGELDNLKSNIFKVQAVFSDAENRTFDDIAVVDYKRRGSVISLVVRGTREEVETYFNSKAPTFFEILPLSLEEIFISEMEEKGYDYASIAL